METTADLTKVSETVITQVTPVVETPAPEVDLMAKVAEFRKAKPAPTENGVFNYQEIENIKDPVSKEIAIKAYKSLQGDYTRKTQELAEQRKTLEAKLQESKTWSPQRIQQELLTNPEFLQAAQQIAAVQNPANSGLTDEQFSALTDKEKAEFSSLKSELNQLKQSSAQANYQAAVAAKDAQLQQKYPNYNTVEINSAMERLAGMSPVDVREFIYKAMNHDAIVKDVYEMGRQEGKGLTQDKINALSSTGGLNVTNNDGVPSKEKGETDMAFMVRLGQFRLAQSKKR